MNRTFLLVSSALVAGIFIGGVLATGSAFAATGARSALSQKVPPPTGKITPWQAMAAAHAKTKQRAFQATFEFEEGHWQYAVMTAGHGTMSEVEINAMNGKVTDVEKAEPAGEAKEFQKMLTKEMKR